MMITIIVLSLAILVLIGHIHRLNVTLRGKEKRIMYAERGIKYWHEQYLDFHKQMNDYLIHDCDRIVTMHNGMIIDIIKKPES